MFYIPAYMQKGPSCTKESSPPWGPCFCNILSNTFTAWLQCSIAISVGVARLSGSGPPAVNHSWRLLFSTSIAAAFFSRRLVNAPTQLECWMESDLVAEGVVLVYVWGAAPVPLGTQLRTGSQSILMQFHAGDCQAPTHKFRLLGFIFFVVVRHPPTGASLVFWESPLQASPKTWESTYPNTMQNMYLTSCFWESVFGIAFGEAEEAALLECTGLLPVRVNDLIGEHAQREVSNFFSDRIIESLRFRVDGFIWALLCELCNGPAHTATVR